MGDQNYPEPTAGALIFNTKGEIFLMKSHKWKGNYVMPGGHIEVGETAREALKREVKEETGLDIHDIEFICYQDFLFDDVFWEDKHFIFLDFACKTDSEEVELNREGEEYLWVKPEKALELPTEPYTKKAIKVWLKKNQ